MSQINPRQWYSQLLLCTGNFNINVIILAHAMSYALWKQHVGVTLQFTHTNYMTMSTSGQIES